MPKITGRVEVLLNGIPLLNKTGAIASGIGISGTPAFEREAIMGDTGVHGYTERPIEARCEVNLTDRDDVNLSELAEVFGNGTVIFRAAGGGKVYTMEGATCLNNFTLTAGDGEVTNVIFSGPYWTEDVSLT